MFFQPLETRRLLSVAIMGDANMDGKTDAGDFAILASNFGHTGIGWSSGDFNGDGKVSGADLSLFVSAFNPNSLTKVYAVRPGDSVQAVANLANPGDVIDILAGTYHGTIKFTRSGTSAAPITINGLDEATTIIDGVGLSSNWTSASYISINNLTFNGARDALQTGGVTIGSNSTMTNCIVQNMEGSGLNMQGKNITVTNVIAQYNGEQGFKGADVSNVTLLNCITRYNNPGLASPNWAGQSYTLQVNGLWYVDPGFETGGGKFVRATNVVIDGMDSYGNIGHGLDFDISNYAVTVRNSSFHDQLPLSHSYEAIGLNIEISYGPSTVTNNSFSNDPGNGLSIQTSSNVSVTGNTFTKANLGLSNWTRGSNWKLSNIAISGNTLNASQITANGNQNPWNSSSLSVMNITIASNIWVNPPVTAVQWASTSYSLANAQKNLSVS